MAALAQQILADPTAGFRPPRGEPSAVQKLCVATPASTSLALTHVSVHVP